MGYSWTLLLADVGHAAVVVLLGLGSVYCFLRALR